MVNKGLPAYRGDLRPRLSRLQRREVIPFGTARISWPSLLSRPGQPYKNGSQYSNDKNTWRLDGQAVQALVYMCKSESGKLDLAAETEPWLIVSG